MSAIASNEGTSPAHQAGSYSGLPNKHVKAANGIDYAYRDAAGEIGRAHV